MVPSQDRGTQAGLSAAVYRDGKKLNNKEEQKKKKAFIRFVANGSISRPGGMTYY